MHRTFSLSVGPRVEFDMHLRHFISILLFVGSLAGSGAAWAVDCLDSGVQLTTQAEVDAAQFCDVVSGELTIGPSGDITNLDSLANLTSVGLKLIIFKNAVLTNFDGLANLTSVGETLYISENVALTNLDGLGKLTSVGETLVVWGNPALRNLDGLINVTDAGALFIQGNHALTSIDGLANLAGEIGSLNISQTTALTNLDALANLTGVIGHLAIESNAALTNLDGLANLAVKIGSLSISRNDALTNLDGLANLVGEIGSLYISGNDALTNLDALANLTSIGSVLSIKGNGNLENVNGLSNLASVGGSIFIGDRHSYTSSGNPKLINLGGFASLLSIGGDLEIAGNDMLESLDGLANLSSIGGYLYLFSNDALTNLNGLANLRSVGDRLELNRNDFTGDCSGIASLLGWPNGPPDDAVGGDILISQNSFGCDSVEEIIASVTGPTQSTIINRTVGNGAVSLYFSNSTTTDTAFPITGYEAACTGSNANLSETPGTPLLDNTPVQRQLTVSGYDPTSTAALIEVDIDITHSDPSDLVITLTSPQGTAINLWNQGSDGSENLVGSFPADFEPVDPLSSVDSEAMDGDWVLSIEDVDVGPIVREGVLNSWGIRITERVEANGSNSPITVNGLTNGREYSCTVAPVTALGAFPLSRPVSATPVPEAPSKPQITDIDYGDQEVYVGVSVANNGGSPITSYSATCTDGTNSFAGTSSSSPITVSGLTNGVTYTCSVTATNSVGTSAASEPSAPVTPQEMAASVLILIDNTGNWHHPFQDEMVTLRDTFAGLPNEINVGIMLFTETGGGNSNTDGGYIRAAIRNMGLTNSGGAKYRDLYSQMIRGTLSNPSDPNSPYTGGFDKTGDKSNGGKPGLAMAEAYYYFAGLAPYAGNNKNKSDWGVNGTYNTYAQVGAHSHPVWALTDFDSDGLNGNALDIKSSTVYNAPVAPGSSANNYIIYLSNGYVSSSSSDNNTANNLLGAEGGDVSTILLVPDNFENEVADEWARFMKASELGITTFTIDVITTTTGQIAGWTALLKSMADGNPNDYYPVDTRTSDPNSPTLEGALDDIFGKILATDTDGDGVPDVNDNCTLVPNPTQCNGDSDAFGNHCDADFNNDGIVNGLDIGPLKAAFGTADATTDLNCDGIVNGLDIGPLKAMFGNAPGPSGLVP